MVEVWKTTSLVVTKGVWVRDRTYSVIYTRLNDSRSKANDAVASGGVKLDVYIKSM